MAGTPPSHKLLYVSLILPRRFLRHLFTLTGFQCASTLVKRSHDRVSMGLCFGLVFYLQRWVWDAQAHVSLGSILLFYFMCYYGSVSCFLSWSSWIGWVESKRIFVITKAFHIFYPDQTERFYFEVQTKQLFWIGPFPWRRTSIFYHNSFDPSTLECSESHWRRFRAFVCSDCYQPRVLRLSLFAQFTRFAAAWYFSEPLA